MAKEPPLCKKCDERHWPFHGCAVPEQQPPGEVVWPAPPEGFREPAGAQCAPGSEQPDMLGQSLGKLGFGAPATVGFTRPPRRS